jgi:NADH dehydrogenase
MIGILPNSTHPRVVIIGGGFAGIKLAKSLKQLPVQVVMIDRQNYHTFQPLLYQVATSALAPDNIAYPIRKIFKKQANFFYRMEEVEEVLIKEKKIITNLGTLDYDYLVIATGARSNYFKNEGMSLSAMPMKDVREALAIRSLVLQNLEKALTIQDDTKRQGYLNIVIIGAGPTGVELAGALAEMKRTIFPVDYPELDCSKIKIILVHAGERVLEMFKPKSSAKALLYLEKLGVEVHLNDRVLEYNGEEVVTKSGNTILSKNVVWTAGVKGNALGDLETNGGNRIKVNQYNQTLSTEYIFALGDVAVMESAELPNGHPMVAQVAIQQAKLLGKNFSALLNHTQLTEFTYHDKGSMATIGKNKAVVELKHFSFTGVFAWFVWMFVHLMSLVGFRNRFVTLLAWIKNYFSSDRSLRLIINPFDAMQAKKIRKQKFDQGLM